jgi:hypothetical protein
MIVSANRVVGRSLLSRGLRLHRLSKLRPTSRLVSGQRYVLRSAKSPKRYFCPGLAEAGTLGDARALTED